MSKLIVFITIVSLLAGCSGVDPRNLSLDAQNNQIDVTATQNSQLEDIKLKGEDVMQDGQQAAASPFLPTPDTSQVKGAQAQQAQTQQQVQQNQQPGQQTAPQPTQAPTVNQVVIKTTKGDITLKLHTQEAPNTVANFVNKAIANFYQGLTIHRVDDMVIQGGDPLGNGTGGGKMAAEYNQLPFTEGSLGVARGSDRKINNDSQFFICLNTQNCTHLTGNYTNFGQVIEGMDVVHSIQIGDKIESVTPIY